MNKGCGNKFNKKNNNQNKNYLVKDIELSAQTNKAIFLNEVKLNVVEKESKFSIGKFKLELFNKSGYVF